MPKHERTKKTAITKDVKRQVFERDRGRCLMCHKPVREADACAHIIPRSQGGMGVMKNIITLCPDCHRKYDTSPNRQLMSWEFAKYIEEIHGPIHKSEVVYDKWGDIFGDKQQAEGQARRT